jgi:hypothetical protein
VAPGRIAAQRSPACSSVRQILAARGDGSGASVRGHFDLPTGGNERSIGDQSSTAMEVESTMVLRPANSDTNGRDY